MLCETTMARSNVVSVSTAEDCEGCVVPVVVGHTVSLQHDDTCPVYCFKTRLPLRARLAICESKCGCGLSQLRHWGLLYDFMHSDYITSYRRSCAWHKWNVRRGNTSRPAPHTQMCLPTRFHCIPEPVLRFAQCSSLTAFTACRSTVASEYHKSRNISLF